ncbi:MAG: hypothetical protein EBT86_06235 [Actinobacteria bacterium]|nr:hypothetical protein [Actinomycetota bacterium]
MAEKENKSIETPIVDDVVVETVAEPVVEVVEDKVIVAPAPTKEVPTLGFDKDGVMGSTTTKAEKVKKEEVVKVDMPVGKVALYSTRNLYADGYGKINVGYNIVPKKYSDFWLTQRGVRLATPTEVAEAFA